MRRQDPRRRQGPHPQPRHRGAGPVGAVDQGRATGRVHGRPRQAPPPPPQGHRQERRPRHPQAAAPRRGQGRREGCRRGRRRRGAAPPQPAAAGPVRPRPGRRLAQQPGAARRRLERVPAAPAGGLRVRRRGTVGRAGAAAGGLPVLPPPRRVPGHWRRLGRVRVPPVGAGSARPWRLRRRMALLIDRQRALTAARGRAAEPESRDDPLCLLVTGLLLHVLRLSVSAVICVRVCGRTVRASRAAVCVCCLCVRVSVG